MTSHARSTRDDELIVRGRRYHKLYTVQAHLTAAPFVAVLGGRGPGAALREPAA